MSRPSGKKRPRPPISAQTDPLAKKPRETQVVQQLEQLEVRQGPIPDPDTLSRYDRLLPGTADRIIKMAETEGQHRREMEGQLVVADIADRKADRAEARVGQLLAFGIASFAIGCSVLVTLYDHPVPGSIIGGGTIVSLVGLFIYGRTAQRQTKDATKSRDQEGGKGT